MSHIAHTMEPELARRVHQIPAAYHSQAQDVHPYPTEEKLTPVVFCIIMAVAVLFIATTIFLSHM